MWRNVLICLEKYFIRGVDHNGLGSCVRGWGGPIVIKSSTNCRRISAKAHCAVAFSSPDKLWLCYLLYSDDSPYYHVVIITASHGYCKYHAAQNRQHCFIVTLVESDKYWIRTNQNNNLMMRRAGLQHVITELWGLLEMNTFYWTLWVYINPMMKQF